jgi:hypothetical protein
MASLKSVLNEILNGNLTPEQQEAMLRDVQESIKQTIANKKNKEEKINRNVDLVMDALSALEKRVNDKLVEISQLPAKVGAPGKDGKDGKNGKDGKDGMSGPAGRDGKDGVDGKDGADGVSVVDARIDFDNSLVITLSDGTQIDAGQLNIYPTGVEGVAILKQTMDAPTGGGGGGGSSDQTVVTVVLGAGSIPSTSQTVLISANSDITLTMPSPASNTGKMIYFKNLTDFDVTFTTPSGLIDDDTTLIVQFKNSSFRLISDGSNWYIF